MRDYMDRFRNYRVHRLMQRQFLLTREQLRLYLEEVAAFWQQWRRGLNILLEQLTTHVQHIGVGSRRGAVLLQQMLQGLCVYLTQLGVHLKELSEYIKYHMQHMSQRRRLLTAGGLSCLVVISTVSASVAVSRRSLSPASLPQTVVVRPPVSAPVRSPASPTVSASSITTIAPTGIPLSLPTPNFSTVTRGTWAPQISPSNTPSEEHTTAFPTRSRAPTFAPEPQPQSLHMEPPPVLTTYYPGDLTVWQHGLLLSTGLEARILARAGEPVLYVSQQSAISFHPLPDAGATFRDTRPENPGGWIYVSNSEVRQPRGNGGVGAITFNADGEIVDYRMVLEGTSSNCGGGKTPWGSWISGEEFKKGLFWQVDPTGERAARPITVGNETGIYESFAADVRRNQYFVTEDHTVGPIRRFVPRQTLEDVDSDPWEILHGDGETTYLLLHPETDSNGTYSWTTRKDAGSANAEVFFPNCEGIDVHNDRLYFVSKRIVTLFILDLASDTYQSFTSRTGLFRGQPDQIVQFKHMGNKDDNMVFFTEDGSRYAGIHARNRFNHIITILEGREYQNEVTGLAFSPDGRHMYFAYQDDGVLFDVVRTDGQPFHANTLNVRYHTVNNQR